MGQRGLRVVHENAEVRGSFAQRTITGVTAGTGLGGGGTSGNVTLTNGGVLSITAGTGISSSGGQNPTVSNTGILSLAQGTGIQVSSGQNPTIGINTSVVPQLNTANTFTGNQTVNGNLSASGVVTGSSYQIGSNLFAFGSYANTNAFLGAIYPILSIGALFHNALTLPVDTVTGSHIGRDAPIRQPLQELARPCRFPEKFRLKSG